MCSDDAGRRRLTELKLHRSEAHARADLRLPWNYTATLAASDLKAKPAA